MAFGQTEYSLLAITAVGLVSEKNIFFKERPPKQRSKTMIYRRHILVRVVAVIVAVAIGHVRATTVSTGFVANSEPNQQFYIVQSGDTLTAIARRFYGQNITSKVQSIFKANCSTLESPDKIYVGQQLILPGLSAHTEQKEIVATDIQFSPAQTSAIRVMTFNIRVDTLLDGLHGWRSRRQIVIGTLAENNADVIGLQEALNHQVRQIQQALPQYSNYAAGRKNGNQKGESCAVFYRKDRFILDDYGTFWFSDTPSIPGSKDWGNLWPRICSWVHLTDKSTGTSFYVYNVHLDNFSQNSRKKSIELLTKRIAARKTPDPFIVMGDFNMEEYNSAMLYLHNANHQRPYPRMMTAWQSLHSGQPGPGTRRRHFIGNSSGHKVDHISVGENTRVLEVNIDRRKVNGSYPSDHFPVIAKILLPTSQKRFAKKK